MVESGKLERESPWMNIWGILFTAEKAGLKISGFRRRHHKKREETKVRETEANGS
jgi:hypothetical protein